MQPLAPKGKGFHPASEETLAMSSEARNQAGMLRTSPIGTERMLVVVLQIRLKSTISHTTTHHAEPKAEHLSAIPRQSKRNRVSAKDHRSSQAEYKAQSFANERMAEVLYANDGGAALMKSTNWLLITQIKNFMHRIGEAKCCH